MTSIILRRGQQNLCANHVTSIFNDHLLKWQEGLTRSGQSVRSLSQPIINNQHHNPGTKRLRPGLPPSKAVQSPILSDQFIPEFPRVYGSSEKVDLGVDLLFISPFQVHTDHELNSMLPTGYLLPQSWQSKQLFSLTTVYTLDSYVQCKPYIMRCSIYQCYIYMPTSQVYMAH